MSGIEHALSQGGSYVLPFKSKAFNLYNAKGDKIELLTHLRRLKAFGNASISCFYRLPDGAKRPIRIVSTKKDTKSISQSERRMLRKASRKQENPVMADTVELNKYTNLEYANEQILELYRARWQIEQLFFRLKSLFGYGDTPNSRDDSVRARFYSKLLLAAICESVLKRMPFPPEIEPAIGDIVGAQFVDRIVCNS